MNIMWKKALYLPKKALFARKAGRREARALMPGQRGRGGVFLLIRKVEHLQQIRKSPPGHSV